MLPYAPGAWYVPDSIEVGYEEPLRPLEGIRADILAVERRPRHDVRR